MRMPAHAFRAAPPARKAASVLAATAVAGVLTAAPAQAHTTLTDAAPAKGAHVTAPTRIQLTYADPVRLSKVVVLDAHNGHHESGATRTVGDKVTQRIATPLAPGVYHVGWRVVAPDGHPLTGEYRFTVVPGSSTAAPSPSSGGGSAAATSSPGASHADSKGGSGAGWWWIGLGVLIVAAASGGVAYLRSR